MTPEAASWERQAAKRQGFLRRMGREAKPGAIGPVIDRDDLERGFPLEDTPPSRRPGRTEARG